MYSAMEKIALPPIGNGVPFVVKQGYGKCNGEGLGELSG
jgi:hypothetical protein